MIDLKKMARSNDMMTRAALAENINATAEILDIIYDKLEGDQDSCKDVAAESIAAHNNTSLETLRHLSNSWHTANTHAQLCANKNTPLDILERFTRSKFDQIRLSLAGNSNITATMIDILSNDDNEDVREQIASNAATSEIVLERLAKDNCVHVKAAVAANKKCNSAVKLKLYDDAKLILDALSDFNADDARATKLIF